MTIVRDCGDFDLKIGFAIGIEFKAQVDTKLQKSIADDYAKLGDEIRAKRERMELELQDFVADRLGYGEAVVRKLVEDRDAENEAAVVAEKVGRAAKQAKREGR